MTSCQARQGPAFTGALVACCIVLSAAGTALAGGTVTTEDGLSLSLDDEGRVVSFRLDGVELIGEPGPLLVARLRLPADRADNLCPHGDLEDEDGDGRIDGWSGLRSIPQLDFAAVPRACDGLPGERALRMKVNDLPLPSGVHTDGMASELFAVTPGQEYQVSACALATRGYLGEEEGALQASMLERYEPGSTPPNGIRVCWEDEAGEQLGDPVVVAPVGVNDHGCKRIGGTVRAPAGAARARVQLLGRLGEDYRTDGDPEAVIYDDVVFAPSPDLRCEGSGDLAQQGNTLAGTVTFPGSSLEAHVRLLGMPDRLRIEGTLLDPAGGEHAVELSVGLPLALDGFSFAADPREAEPVDDGGIQEWTTSAAGGAAMPISVYPLVAVDDPAVGTLALHLPRDDVRFARLRWNGPAGRLEAVFLVGLSPLAEHLPSRGRFRIDLLAAPAGLGWRGAWAKTYVVYGAEHPGWFHPLYNDLAAYEDLHQEAFEDDPEAVRDDDEAGIYSAEYILVDFDVNELGQEGDEPPDYDGLMRVIEERQTTAPTEKLRAYYRTADATLAGDDNGDRVMKHLAVKDWTGGKYEANLMSDVDPWLDEGMGPWLWDWKIEPAVSESEELGACLDGIEFDNFLLSNVDYRDDHVARARGTLTFTESSLRPGVHSASQIWDYLGWLRESLAARETSCPPRGFSANWWAPGIAPLLAERIDFFVGEGSRMTTHQGIWRDDMLLYRRAISWQKVFAAACKEDFDASEEEEFRRVQEKALLYDTFLHRWHGATWDDALEQLALELYRPIAHELHDAGWEPLSRASADVAGIHLERYGNAADGSLHVATLNRTGAEASYVLTLEKNPLGIAAVTEARDLVRDEVLPVTDTGDAIEIEDTLPEDRGRVFRFAVVVADRDGDGVIDHDDCAPADGMAWSVPGRIRDLQVHGGEETELTWSDQAAACGPGTVHDIAAGSLLDLLGSGDFTAAACAAGGVPSPPWTDPDPAPSAGDGRYYLVRARNACGEGPWGYDSGWERRGLEVCP